MAFLDRLKALNPLGAFDGAVRTKVEESAHVAVQTVIADLGKFSPELTSLLAGEQVVLVVSATVTLQLKQKGE